MRQERMVLALTLEGQPRSHKPSVQANKPLISTKCWTMGHEIITLRVSAHELESHKP